MKTRSMAIALAVLGLILAILAISLNRCGQRGADRVDVLDPTKTTTEPVLRIVGRDSDRRLDQVAERSKLSIVDTFANLALLGTPMPAAAQPYMANAVRSGMVIERERRKFSQTGNGARLLDGLNQRLFIEDYNYAARATGALDPKDAESSYTTFASNLTQIVDIQQGEPYPISTAGSAEVRECYTRYLESHDPAFQTIWNQVAVYDPSGYTDLYHGALVYAGFQSSLRQFIRDDEVENLRHMGEVMSANAGAENLEELVRVSEENLRKYADELRLVQDATREIFADRMRSRGLDPAILDGLEQVEIDAYAIGPQSIIR